MITGKQIRAARIFLEWDAEDLATHAGVNRETVFNIERGTVQPRPSTIDKIVKAFNDHRVEFLEDQGVRFRPDGIQTLKGQKGLITLMEDIYHECSQGTSGDIVLSGLSESDFEKHLGEYDKSYVEKMSKVEGLRIRQLIAEGDYNFVSSAYAEYRWVSLDQFEAVPFYVYADKLAIILFSPGSEPKVYLLQSVEIANAYRQQFNAMWQQAKEIPNKKTQS